MEFGAFCLHLGDFFALRLDLLFVCIVLFQRPARIGPGWSGQPSAAGANKREWHSADSRQERAANRTTGALARRARSVHMRPAIHPHLFATPNLILTCLASSPILAHFAPTRSPQLRPPVDLIVNFGRSWSFPRKLKLFSQIASRFGLVQNPASTRRCRR